MKRIKRFRIPLSEGNTLDVKLEVEGGSVKGFVLNLRCRIDNKWHEVYRMDTAHGYLHEQRYWISDRPIPLTRNMPLQYVFESFMEQVRKNHERYMRYYIEKRSGDYE